MEGKWTKGEWTADGPDCFGDWNIHHPADSLAVAAVVCDPLPGAPTMVAAVVTNLRSAAEVAANARLIAQAPAMAEALEAMVEGMEDVAQQADVAMRREGGEGYWAVEAAQALITRARALLTAIKGE